MSTPAIHEDAERIIAYARRVVRGEPVPRMPVSVVEQALARTLVYLADELRAVKGTGERRDDPA